MLIEIRLEGLVQSVLYQAWKNERGSRPQGAYAREVTKPFSSPFVLPPVGIVEINVGGVEVTRLFVVVDGGGNGVISALLPVLHHRHLIARVAALGSRSV